MQKEHYNYSIVNAEHQLDFKHVKGLCGQGKLYFRLDVIKDILTDHEKAEDLMT